MTETYKKEAEQFLEGISIIILRNIARLVGVFQATTRKKHNLINNIIKILTSDHEADTKFIRGCFIKMGVRVREHCESILDQLLSILGISDSLRFKIIKFPNNIMVSRQEIPVSFNAQLSFGKYINGILALCEGNNELEVIVRFLNYQWQIRNNEHKHSI